MTHHMEIKHLVMWMLHIKSQLVLYWSASTTCHHAKSGDIHTTTIRGSEPVTEGLEHHKQYLIDLLKPDSIDDLTQSTTQE